MAELDRVDQEIRQRFGNYSRAATPQVLAPGTEDVYRAVLYRQRRRTTVLLVACVVMLALGLGYVTRGARGDSLPTTVPTSPSPVVGSPSASPSVSASPSASPSPSVSPSASSPSSAPSSGTPSPRPSPSSSPPAAGPAKRSYPTVEGSELHLVAESQVTLHAVEDRYEGTVNVDVYNSGTATEDWNRVYLTLPDGVTAEDSGSLHVGGGCVGAAPPETWTCSSDPVSAMGGYARCMFQVKVSIAPGASTRTLPGFAVRFVAIGRDNAVLTDVTPDDNKAVVTLILPPA